MTCWIRRSAARANKAQTPSRGRGWSSRYRPTLASGGSNIQFMVPSAKNAGLGRDFTCMECASQQSRTQDSLDARSTLNLELSAGVWHWVRRKSAPDEVRGAASSVQAAA